MLHLSPKRNTVENMMQFSPRWSKTQKTEKELMLVRETLG